MRGIGEFFQAACKLNDAGGIRSSCIDSELRFREGVNETDFDFVDLL
jgi:hypothetical protein